MSRRIARDSFFKESGSNLPTPLSGSVSAVKQDFNCREREVDKDSEKISSNSSHALNYNSAKTFSSSKEDSGYVGYASLPNQVYRKSVKKGFDFTLMVVGESGLGKSTLINSLFLTDIYNSEHVGPSMRAKKTTQVETTRVVLKEGGVQLRLSIVDTPGFGDSVDNTNCWEPVINYIDERYEEYLNAESRVNRKILPDTRVHCCLYFIAPTGHGLKALDIEFMRRLHEKVNIIPVVAKADSMTPEECRDFKKTILNEIAQNKINIYDFPVGGDEEEKKILKKLRERVPFAVIGSNTLIDVQGKKVRGRVYPWGVVEVENLEHNDFLALKNMLIRMHMQDLKDVMSNVHYENYRFNKLATVASEGPGSSRTKAANSNKSPMLQIEEEKREHIQKMKKMEAEMEQVFEMKVKEKLQKLKDSETDLHRRAEQMKKNLEQQERDLEERARAFELERETWEDQNRALLDDQFMKKDKKKMLF